MECVITYVLFRGSRVGPIGRHRSADRCRQLKMKDEIRHEEDY